MNQVLNWFLKEIENFNTQYLWLIAIIMGAFVIGASIFYNITDEKNRISDMDKYSVQAKLSMILLSISFFFIITAFLATIYVDLGDVMRAVLFFFMVSTFIFGSHPQSIAIISKITGMIIILFIIILFLTTKVERVKTKLFGKKI